MMEVAILVSDCSRRGVQAAGRIAKLMKELNFKPQKTGLIVNRVPDGKLDAGTLEDCLLYTSRISCGFYSEDQWH